MSFLGLEKPIEYSGVLVFDPTMAKMVLDAQDKYFNVLYADYQQGLQDMKEFKKEYGDFVTPILADLEWYNKNVTGKVRNFINDAYARGIDLTRSAEGRAAISQLINSIDVGSVNKLRSSAENAREFLRERSRLEAQGLYNPLLAKYEGFDPNTYSTLDQLDAEGNVIAGRGIWDKMSPTRITDMATFGNPYFEGMKPNVHSASRNGVSYSIESITEDDLKNVADAHFNELVSTPQGQLMYKYYQDLAKSTGGNARDMFNQAVVDGQRRRIYTKDDYDDNYFKQENLKLQRSSNALAWEKFRWDKDKEQQELDIKRQQAEDKDLDGFSLALRWFDKALANAWSVDGISKDWWDMKDRYGEFGKSVDKIFHDFGQSVKKYDKSGTFNNDLYNQDLRKAYNDANRSGKYTPELLRDGDYPKPNKDNVKYYSGHNYNSRIKRYESAFSFDMDPTSVAKAIGGPGGTLSGNDRVVQATAADISKLYSVNDYISNTAGFTAKHVDTDTKKIRKEIEYNGANNVTITPLGTGYGSLRKAGGNFEAAPKVRVTITDKDSGEIRSYDAYYDLGLRSATTKGGAYVGNYKEPIVKGGSNDFGNMTAEQPKFGVGDMQYTGPVRIGAIRSPGLSLPEIGNIEFGTREFNMYPDYNLWTSFGNWDTRESHALSAGASKKLGTY